MHIIPVILITRIKFQSSTRVAVMVSSLHWNIIYSDAERADSTSIFVTFPALNISQIHRSIKSSILKGALHQSCGTFDIRNIWHLKKASELLDEFPKLSVKLIMASDFSMLKLVPIAQPVEDSPGRMKSGKNHHVRTGKARGTRRYHQISCSSEFGRDAIFWSVMQISAYEHEYCEIALRTLKPCTKNRGLDGTGTDNTDYYDKIRVLKGNLGNRTQNRCVCTYQNHPCCCSLLNIWCSDVYDVWAVGEPFDSGTERGPSEDWLTCQDSWNGIWSIDQHLLIRLCLIPAGDSSQF